MDQFCIFLAFITAIYIIKELVQPKKSLNRDFYIYIIKEFVQPKMSLNRECLIWKERGRECERERGGRVCVRERGVGR
jgi:hypothetical protein